MTKCSPLRAVFCSGLCALLTGCFGISELDAASSDDAVDLPGPSAVSRGEFQCDPGAQPEAAPLRRLSRQQYVNTVRDLVTHVAPTHAAAVLVALREPLERVPVDTRVGAHGERRGGFSVLDQSLQQAHAEAVYDVALAVARELTRSQERSTALLGPCASDATAENDAACLEAFVRDFGARVFRRPLDESEVALILTDTASAPVSAEVVADVVGLLFASPHLVFFLEHGTDDAAQAPALSAYELASRLSYHFWRTAPDDALWDAAASGALLDEETLRAHVARLAADPRADDTWREFFSEWFGLEELPELDGLSTSARFLAFAGEDVPTADTREAAIEDVLHMAGWTVRQGGDFSALLTERRSFTTDPLLARLYGAATWDGLSEPPTPASTQRSGLLTRIAFLASGSHTTRPILKGARIRDSLLCDVIQLPEGNVAAVAPTPSATATAREVVETLTESTPSCAGCHRQRINPLGFSTEGFDALGRERTMERLFDEAGMLVTERPVNTRTQPFIRSPTDDAYSEGAEDLTRLLDESGKVHSCFTRQYFRFTHARAEDRVADGCALQRFEQAALEGMPLIELFQLPALQPDFRVRSFQ